ncbi:hypothetical protein FJZ33_12270, partial [Candidatus Poribacteria bacterium]|nr:hypothetical protein [Candidatus Poribacteria bacterium]
MKIQLSNLIFLFIFIICQNAFCIERLSIDTFDEYVWDPQGGSLQVEKHNFGVSNQGMLLRCDFSKKQDRCTWDRNVNLDLTKYGRFSLQIYAEDPSAIRSGTLYFQSGNGWYVAKLPVERKGWKKMSILKGSFYMEGLPTGWHSINKIRFSFWKSGNMDTVVIVDDFEAIADDIVVVMGNLTAGKSASDARLVRDYHRTLSKILDDSGLDFEIVNDTDVESNVLSGKKIAIFPYNTYMSDKEIGKIESFVSSGGKIMLFYSFPEKLAKLLGIDLTGWEKEEPIGRFSYIVFDQKGLEGLPESIYQGSWNIRMAKPVDKDTKVVGYWADGQASNSEIPAVIVNPNGTFMGHILLPDDMFNKRLMFLALFYHIVPDMREYLSQLVLKNAGKLAGFDDFSHTVNFIQENLEKIPEDRKVKSLEHLEKSKKSLGNAEDSYMNKLYGNALNMSREVSHELTKAFFTSLPSKQGEFRAIWGNSVMGVAEWDWDKTIRHLKEN